jgi:hypothetical protein
MYIKCLNCSHDLISFSQLIFKSLPKGGVRCGNCGSIHKLNVFIFIVPMLLGFLVNMLLLAIFPSYASLYTQFIVALPLMLLLVIKKPMVLIKKSRGQADLTQNQ